MRDDDATLRTRPVVAQLRQGRGGPDHVRDICRDDLVPHVLDALALADDSRRRAHVSVLAVLVDESSSTYVPRFVPLKQLRDASNRDVDVFENVALAPASTAALGRLRRPPELIRIRTRRARRSCSHWLSNLCRTRRATASTRTRRASARNWAAAALVAVRGPPQAPRDGH